MITLDSEKLFADYLAKHGFTYEQNYPVGTCNVDFRIVKTTSTVLCDVKEVRDSKKDSYGKLDASSHIRGDIKKLREKFKKKRPDQPVILITMNFSTNFFTGLTVATALLGDIGFDFDKMTLSLTSPLHHLPKGNAVLTQTHNRSISGVFVFDIDSCKHYLFRNPFTAHPVAPQFFPEVRVIDLDRAALGNAVVRLSDIIISGTEN